MTPFDDWYNGKLIEYNRSIRFHHETRHPRQIQHDRERGIPGYIYHYNVRSIPVIAGNRNVNHLTPEEREYADYYDFGTENRGDKATGGTDADADADADGPPPAEIPAEAVETGDGDAERGGRCGCCCGWGFRKFLRGIRDAMIRNR